MNIKVVGKDLVVTDAIRDYAEKKMEKLSKYMDDFDKNIDILEGQIRKVKTKKEKMDKDASIRISQEEDSAEPENEIIKELYYEIKPMTPEDAKLKLQEKKGNTFLTFVNLENGKVNVIYKLKDNKNYGLIEPEA